MELCRDVAITSLCALLLELYVTSKPEEIVLNLLLHHACIAALVLNSTGAAASSRGKAENKEEEIKFLGCFSV